MSSKQFTKEFNDLTTKFLFLNCDKGCTEQKNADEISNLLNELSSLDYQSNKFLDYKAVLRLLESIITISVNEGVLMMKASCLISVLVNKHKVCLPEHQFEATMEWLMKYLKMKEYEAESEIFFLMSVLFRNHAMFTYKFFKKLLNSEGCLTPFLNLMSQNKGNSKTDDTTNYENITKILACFDSLLIFLSEEQAVVTQDDLDILKFLGNTIINLLYRTNLFTENSSQCSSSLSYSLHILQKIAEEDSEWCEKNVGELLGIAKQYIKFGVFEQTILTPQKVLPSQQSIVESNLVCVTYKGGKVPKTRKPRTITKNKKQEKKVKDQGCDKTKTEGLYTVEPLINKTSDSEFSETESGKIQNILHKQTRIRLNAISLVGTIAKNVEKKICFGYWHSLLPFEERNSTELDSKCYGILTSAVKDPNPKCRLASLQVISLLFYGAKVFLMQAENSEKIPKSYTPFSVTLGNAIVSMYEELTFAIQSESSLPVLTQVLKCLGILVQATPFTRLRNGFVRECINHTRSLIYHKDPTIQVAALMVIEFFISTPEITAEITECLGLPIANIKTVENENRLNDSGAQEIIETEFYDEIDPYDNEISVTEANDLENCELTNIPWLLEKILENLDLDFQKIRKTPVTTSAPVRIECLQVLTALAPHIIFFKDHLVIIAKGLKNTLMEEQNEIRLHSAKCLDTFGHAINTFLLSNAFSNEMIKCKEFWSIVLPCVIEKIQDPAQSSPLKCILCDFLSNVGVHMFERFSHSQQMMLISLLTGISCNEESPVRASAVRALAVYVMFPSLRNDLCFIENTANFVVELLKEKNAFVRIKSSWSLGNISDVLIPLSNGSKLDSISEDLLQKMFEISIELLNDNDKVKCNAVRTIGNLLRLITKEQILLLTWRSLCFRGIEKLVNCLMKSGNAKVKWNACYALGNFMKNDILFTNDSNFNWQDNVFSSLCDVIVNSPNFKVRINGVTALLGISDRTRFGQHFILVWSSLLVSIEQSDNLIDFNEYKHRDNLQEQLCIALCHMIKIAKIDDFVQMKMNITNLEIIRKTWKRVVSRIVPENASSLINLPQYLKTVQLNIGDSNVEQKNAVFFLRSCFALQD